MQSTVRSVLQNTAYVYGDVPLQSLHISKTDRGEHDAERMQPRIV